MCGCGYVCVLVFDFFATTKVFIYNTNIVNAKETLVIFHDETSESILMKFDKEVV